MITHPPDPPDPNYPPPPPGGYPPPPPGYGPPTGYPTPQYGQPGGYPPATAARRRPPGGLGVRFGARVIDGILVGIVAVLLALIFGLREQYPCHRTVFGPADVRLLRRRFEVTQGWTPGKKMLGLTVHGPGGAPKPDFKQSAIRNSFTLLPIIPFVGGLLAFIAYIVIAVTINGSPTKQGKHDELAGGTQVVKG